MARPTPAQVDRLLASIEYPIDKTELMQVASRKRTAQSVRSLLEQLPARSFDAPANVRNELEKLEPALAAGDGAAQPISAQEQDSAGITLPGPVQDVVATARIQGTRIAGQTGTQLAALADERRGDAARMLTTTATTIREASASLEQRGQTQLGQAVSTAAEKLEAVSRYVEQTDARQMASEAQQVARRYPVAVVAAGVALGAVAVRLMKSTRPAQSQPGSGRPSGNGSSAADAVGLLEADHSAIRRLLRRGDSAAVNQRTAQLRELKELLQSHERMEEEVFYPALQNNSATRELVAESFAEHHVVDEILGEIEQTDVADEMWKARFTAMRDNLDQHIAEEEQQLLPLAKKALTKGELAELGRRMTEVKEAALAAAPAAIAQKGR